MIMTEIYIIRHSEPNKKINTNLSNDNLQLINEKSILSLNGLNIAKNICEKLQINDINAIYSSNYVRAEQTAQVFADKYNLEINVDDRFGERKFGVNSWDELPNGFGIKQFEDENYKIPNGESQKEVQERMYNALIDVLNNNTEKNVMIFSHSTAIRFLFMKWCILKDDGFYFKNKKIIDKNECNFCESFKLKYNQENKLIDMEKLDI
jgi:2,3-bisphosphoglycerate-dependent phosphoglycerate mutase